MNIKRLKRTIKLKENVPEWIAEDWENNKHKWKYEKCKVDLPVKVVDIFGLEKTLYNFEHEWVKYLDTGVRCYYCGKPKQWKE